MKVGKRPGLKRRELVARLTGIKTPIGGVDWQPPREEQNKAREVLTYLAEQPVLSDPYDVAIGSFVVQSIIDLRGRLRSEIEELQTNSVLREGLHVMHAVCRRFLEENQSPRSGYGPPYEGQLHSTLGELRALFGILPPEPD
jgi:hypothetical protein